MSLEWIVPGLPPDYLDSLREAVAHGEHSRAQTLLGWLRQVVAERAAERHLVKVIVIAEAVAPLEGAERKAAEAFLDGLTWPS